MRIDKANRITCNEMRVQDAGDAEEGLLDVEDGEVARSEAVDRGYALHCVWTICPAAALITTKQLLVTHSYHYPLTIAFRSFAAILFVYTILLRVASASYTIPGNTQWSWGSGLRKLNGVDLLWNKCWVYTLPAAVAAAASFPMFLEGVLHMPSLPVLVMLFPLAYAAEATVLIMCCSPSRSQICLPVESLGIAAASSMILYNEYRLMAPGLIWGVTSILLMGLSRACLVIGIERCGTELAVDSQLKAKHGFVIMTCVLGIMFSGGAGYHFEHIHAMHSFSPRTLAIMAVNLIFMVGTAFSGTFPITFTPVTFDAPGLHHSSIPLPFIEVLPPLLSSLIVISVSVYWYPTYVSMDQIAQYLLATAFVCGAYSLHQLVLYCVGHGESNGFNVKDVLERRKPTRLMTFGSMLAVIILFSWSLSSFSTMSIDSLSRGLPASFDNSYLAESKFDIVVSMYEESPASIKTMILKLKSTTYLSTIPSDIRVIIYTKNPSADLDLLKSEIGADIITQLPNTGREGGTYLHHIVQNWNTLAAQTMFIQAHAHNMRELLPRISSYLVPQTGMLSLGFTGITCSCGSCSDRWGWEDKWSIIPSLYTSIYSTPCSPNQPITLTYKGQFVASAKRIRGIAKSNYESLLDAVTSKDGWAHNSTLLAMGGNGVAGEDDGGKGDSESNPYFGFTLERVWGLLLQCGIDERVAARCPSLLSGMGVGGKVGDCQCLDEEVEVV